MTRQAGIIIKILNRNMGIDAVKTGAEVGVWSGDTSACLLRHLPNLTLHMVDCWEPKVSLRATRHKTEKSLIAAEKKAMEQTEFASDRRFVHKMTSEEAAILIADGSLDFAFIDACHLYDDVRQDIALWYPKIKVGGLVAGHDYVASEGSWVGRTWGVKKAVDEFAAVHDYKPIVWRTVWWVIKK